MDFLKMKLIQMNQTFTYYFAWNLKKLIFNLTLQTLMYIWVDFQIYFGVITPLTTNLLNYSKSFGFQNLLELLCLQGFELLSSIY